MDGTVNESSQRGESGWHSYRVDFVFHCFGCAPNCKKGFRSLRSTKALRAIQLLLSRVARKRTVVLRDETLQRLM